MIVAAVGRNGVIGIEGRLPWRIPDDLARFKKMTMGSTLVMGRATFESIGRALPGRTTIVLTRNSEWSHPDVSVAGSLEEAIVSGRVQGDVFISGGAAVYRAALDVADQMELTEVDQAPDGDTYFPDFDPTRWDVIERDPHPGFTFVTYRRR